MNEELSTYLAGVYSAGFDKRAADVIPGGPVLPGGPVPPPAAPPGGGPPSGNNMALGAGIGAGLGGLGGLASYYLMDGKKRRRASLLNRIIGGGLLGAGAGAVAPLVAQGSQPVQKLFQTGDGTVSPAIRKPVNLVDMIARPAAAFGLMKGYKATRGAGGAALMQGLRSYFGNGTDPDDSWVDQAGRSAVDFATGAHMAHSFNNPVVTRPATPTRPARSKPVKLGKPVGKFRGRAAGGVYGVLAGLLMDQLASRAQRYLQ